MSNFIKSTEFNAGDILFSGVNKNNYNGKFVYLNYQKQKNNPVLKVPEMDMPYGSSIFRPQDNPNADPKVSINVTFRERETNSKIDAFYNACEAFDNAVISAAVKNSKEWFGSKKTEEVIRDKYSPMIKEHKEGKYAPTLKVALRRRNAKFTCECYDENREFIEMDMENFESYFNKGTKVSMLIRAWQVWFAAGKFGVTWEMVQCVVKPSKQMSGVCLIDDSDDEEEDVVDVVEESNVSGGSKDEDLDNVVVDSSDSDSSDVEVEEPVVVEKKKRGRRKK